jgi:hypothetical protein
MISTIATPAASPIAASPQSNPPFATTTVAGAKSG